MRVQQVNEDRIVGGGRGQRLPDQRQRVSVKVVAQQIDFVAKAGVQTVGDRRRPEEAVGGGDLQRS